MPEEIVFLKALSVFDPETATVQLRRETQSGTLSLFMLTEKRSHRMGSFNPTMADHWQKISEDLGWAVSVVDWTY